jgi:hypothetical protein
VLLSVLPAAAAGQNAIVRSDPAQLEVNAGQIATLSVVLAYAQNVYGIDVSATFDPQLVEVVDADSAKAGIQATPGAFPKPDFVARNVADNQAGTLRYAVTQVNPTEPVSGSGVIFTVQFRAKAPSGQSAFTISSVDLTDLDGIALGVQPESGMIRIVPAGWNAACTSGVCKFSKSEVAPDPAVTGSGQVAKITLTGVAPGTFNMAISNDTLSDIDGAPLAHTLGTPLPITVCGLATISGKITLQGRPGNNVNAGTVSLVEQPPINFTPPGVASVAFSASDGAYTILNVPYIPGGSSYKIVAEHGLYLDNEDTITVSGNLANKNTRLWGGDANNDGDVTIADLSCIGGSFGGPVAGSCVGGSSDINADGIINIQDLSLTGGNFDKCGAQPWDWVGGTPVLCP